MQRTESWSLGGLDCEFGFARLSIVDLSDSGAQPMASEDGRLVMVFNGEIYNSPELRRECERAGHQFRSRMDGEVILHLWEMEGPDALARLNGIFAIAMLDRLAGDVFLARDPLGVKPLFYSQHADQMWFASELSSLIAAGAPVGALDRVGLAQFLTFLWIPDPRTPYLGARSLEPGQLAQWGRHRATLRRYTPALRPVEQPVSVTESSVVAEAEGRLRAAVERQLRSDVPVGVMASGGVDSSLIWWAGGAAIDRAFNIHWSGETGRERLDQDTAAVRELARMLNTSVEYIDGQGVPVLEHGVAGDLFADPARGLTTLIAGHARALGLKVLLSGQGGDELFAGYRRHRVAQILGRAPLRSAARMLRRLVPQKGAMSLRSEYASRLARASAERDPFAAYMQLCVYSDSSERARALNCSTLEVSDDVVWQRHREVWETLPSTLSMLRKATTLDLTVYLPGLGLAYVDRGGMEHGVEIRVPWLDLEFVRWTLTLPDQALMMRGRGKWIPRRLAARSFGRAIANRPKRGFGAPIEHLKRARRPEFAVGSRGFRQGEYYAHARNLLDSFVDATPGKAVVVARQ